MAERLAALVLLQGQTEAVPMSLQRAALAQGQGGAKILTVVNWPKGKSLSKKLFYNKDGKLNAKAQRGMDDPFVNVSKKDTMNIIKPKPRGGDTLKPVESLDIIYGEDSMQEILQYEKLCNSQMFISMTKLPKELQDRYIENIVKGK